MDARHHGKPYGEGRSSSQRILIARIVESLDRAFTIDDLLTCVRSHEPATGTATVYRAVAAMEESGYLERVGERAGSALYAHCEHAGSEHHHHVVCDECGRIEPAECPMPPAATSSGFLVTRHEVTLYGLCPDCMNRGS